MSTPEFTEILPPDLRPTTHTLLTSLWSNYGHIYRLTFPAHPPLILKLIRPPPTTAASESHMRKLLSYHAERHFYAHLSQHLDPARTPIATPLPVNPAHADTALLMADLAPAFPGAHRPSSPAHAHAVVKWLAGFHAAFWGRGLGALLPPPSEASPAPPPGVWRSGGYWYLDTRAEEMRCLVASGEFDFLLPHAGAVARRLRVAPGDPGATLIHGDCKGSNAVFGPAADGVRCALYDFQYVGVGLGVQDLAYFLATSVDGRLLEGGGEERLLRLYYEEVVAALRGRGVAVGEEWAWGVVCRQWEWALVDWMRFMGGWGVWGGWEWVEGRARGICERWAREGGVGE